MLRNSVCYPFSVQPLVIGIPRSVKLIEEVTQGDHLLGLLAMKDSSIEEPLPGQVYEVGTVGRVLRVLRTLDNTLQAVVQGLERFRVEHWLRPEPYLKARIRVIPDIVQSDLEMDALQRSLRELAQEVINLSPIIPNAAGDFLAMIQDPRMLVYMVLFTMPIEVNEGQKLLEMDDLKDKLRALIIHLTHEKEVLSLG